MTSELFGWDIGGAHVKACRLQNGAVVDVAQWACALWQGLHVLEAVLTDAQTRWPGLAEARHAVTMTGEMVDLFEHREDGVGRIAALLERQLVRAAGLHFFAGDAGWCSGADVSRHWMHIASANWLATAQHAALALPTVDGIVVDIGSTTTDLIAFRDARVLTAARSDAQRLASGELVYHGVVRTPLCALGPRINWRGAALNVMNEFFATVADVYRLTGELDPAHDLHASADNQSKDPMPTRRRLARMIGLDQRDGSEADWLAFARAWRECQVETLATQLKRVTALHRLSDEDLTIVSAGCGDFLVADIVRRAFGPGARARQLAYGSAVARLGPAAPSELARWAQVCAPCVAVAALLDGELR